MDSPQIAKRGAYTAIIGGTGALELSQVEMEFYKRLQAALTIASNGQITLTQALVFGSPISVASGGTGLSSYTIGDLIYASAATTLAKLAGVATGNVLLAGGVATAPAWGKITNAHIDAAAAIVYSKLSLAASILNADIATAAAIAFSKLEQGTALSILGVAGNAAAAVASIVAANDHEVLRRSGTAVGFGAVNLAQAAAITGDLPYANFTPATAASRLLLRGSAGGAGDWQEGTVGTGLTISGTELSATATDTVSLLIAASGNKTDAAASNVSTVAISGLSVNDAIDVRVQLESVTQATAQSSLYNSTDSVALVNLGGAGVSANNRYIGRSLTMLKAHSTTVLVMSLNNEALDGTPATNIGAATFTTNWTGSWTLALRIGAVTAGGTLHWRWAAYKVAGQ